MFNEILRSASLIQRSRLAFVWFSVDVENRWRVLTFDLWPFRFVRRRCRRTADAALLPVRWHRQHGVAHGIDRIRSVWRHCNSASGLYTVTVSLTFLFAFCSLCISISLYRLCFDDRRSVFRFQLKSNPFVRTITIRVRDAYLQTDRGNLIRCSLFSVNTRL